MIATATVLKVETMLECPKSQRASCESSIEHTHPQKNKLLTVQYSNSLITVVRPCLKKVASAHVRRLSSPRTYFWSTYGFCMRTYATAAMTMLIPAETANVTTMGHCTDRLNIRMMLTVKHR